MILKLGRYRHYKGPEYEVLGVVRHSETEEYLALYRPLYGDRALWVRPLAMFAGDVELDGRLMPRFEWLGPESEHDSPLNPQP